MVSRLFTIANFMRFAGLLIFIVCLFSIQRISAQTLKADLATLIGNRAVDQASNIRKDNLPGSMVPGRSNDIKIIFLGILRGYQVAISSQDKPSCAFHPSCSSFGRLALKEAGLVRGMLLTGDRLQRCHGLPGTLKNYEISREHNRLADPLQVYIEPEKPSHGNQEK